MSRKCPQIYVDDETIRRVEVAAQKHKLPVTTYCLTAIQHQLEEDGIEVDELFVEADQAQFQTVLEKIIDLQQRILKRRDGQSVDVDALLEELREERDEEALGLR
jgi:hypothetical protein